MIPFRSFIFATAWATVGLSCQGAATIDTPPAVSRPGELTEQIAGAAKSVNPTDQRKTLQEFGITYVLVSTTRNETLDTEEYAPEGETAAAWSQLITYQRLLFPTPAAPDRFVVALKRQIEDSGDGVQFRVVQQGRQASIFAVHYPRTEQQPEQVEIALATVPDPKRPNELHVIQFSLNPSKVDLAKMEVMVKRWQARFQSQAASLNR